MPGWHHRPCLATGKTPECGKSGREMGALWRLCLVVPRLRATTDLDRFVVQLCFWRPDVLVGVSLSPPTDAVRPFGRGAPKRLFAVAQRPTATTNLSFALPGQLFHTLKTRPGSRMSGSQSAAIRASKRRSDGACCAYDLSHTRSRKPTRDAICRSERWCYNGDPSR